MRDALLDARRLAQAAVQSAVGRLVGAERGERPGSCCGCRRRRCCCYWLVSGRRRGRDEAASSSEGCGLELRSQRGGGVGVGVESFFFVLSSLAGRTGESNCGCLLS